MFIFLAFQMKAKKPNLPAAKCIILHQVILKGFELVIQPGHQDDKFPAVFGGIVLDHFHPESDPKKI